MDTGNDWGLTLDPAAPRGDAAGHISRIDLADGACLLTFRGARPQSDARMAILERARIITMAWGDRYIDDLLEITLPALLAPGNLPAFADQFECELVIVTETRLFDRIAGSATVAALLRILDLRLVPIDDLLSPWYGITLTYALVRGFADLGAAMTDTHLVFLNADFILADGCYARLAEEIKCGERLVVAPSYCMNLEETIDILRRRRDPASGVLSVPKRELAAIILAHRHNTIRAKTINQQLFRIHRYDQFYWYVDEHTLLGRQMPIAVVYMRPERVLTELPTFWDYGVISEYCPTVTPCVLGDSDDFLMAELRNENTFRELLHLGWPSVEEIAADLSSFTTQDHRHYGRYTLTLHAGELPPDIASAERALATLVDAVYAQLKPPISYRDHPFWAPQFPRFIARQQQASRELRAARAAEANRRNEDASAPCHQQIARSSAQILALRSEIRAAEHRLTAKRRLAEIKLAELEDQFRLKRTALEHEVESSISEDEVSLRKLHNALGECEAGLSALQQRARAARPLIAAFEDDSILPQSTDAALRQPEATPAANMAARCARVYRKVFGALPRTTPYHPYHTMLQPALAALNGAAEATHSLIISSGGALTSVLTRDLGGEKLTVTPGLLVSRSYRASMRDRPKFGLCFCDLALEDLVRFREMFSIIRPFLTPDCRIIIVHHNLSGQAIDERTYEFTTGLFPRVGRSRIAFTGSYPGALSVRWFARALQRFNIARPMGMAALAGTLALCAPLARLAWWREQRRDPLRLPTRCTNMTIVVDLP